VVGLVCIRIFGYTDARAEGLAEQTGVAFQLTNILRDVREDAERGRIYLPLEDLESHNVTVAQLASIRDNRQLTLDERALMEMEAARAREYYAAADSLLPLIAPDSRAALWVLVTIYRRLLDRIVAAQYQVFGKRIQLSTIEKLWILLRGLWMAFRLRSAGKR
jgi:phytoene synthase